jgi:hypothetical protein
MCVRKYNNIEKNKCVHAPILGITSLLKGKYLFPHKSIKTETETLCNGLYYKSIEKFLVIYNTIIYC